MASVTDYIKGRFQNDKKEPVNIGGFNALVRISEKISMSADAPDTFLEDGTHANDHIINNPVVLSIEGEVSDVFLESKIINEVQRTIQSQAGNIAQYLPGRTQAQISRVSGIANDIQAGLDRANAALAAGRQATDFLGLTEEAAGQRSNQEKFIDHIESIYNSKQLIKIEMPYRTYENMVLTSIELSHDNEINSTGFSIEAKEFRLAEIQFAEIKAAKNPATGTDGALAEETDKGLQEGEPPDRSFASYAFSGVRSLF